MSTPQQKKLQELADLVPCWGKYQTEVVLEPVEGLTYVRAPGQSGSFEFVLLDTRGDIDALEEALRVLAGQPTGAERIVEEIWRVGAEFEEDAHRALTCIFEVLGQYEHVKYLRERNIKGSDPGR